MCLEDKLPGQKAAAGSEEEDDDEGGGEEAEGAENGGGTSPAAAASAASDWLRGPYMPPWLTSLGKLLCGDEEEANGKMKYNQVKYLQLSVLFHKFPHLFLIHHPNFQQKNTAVRSCKRKIPIYYFF